MMSWFFPPNRSARLSFPLGPSNRYFLSTFSQGISRRSRLSSSRKRVNSFSLAKSFLRAASHSAEGTTFALAFSIVAVVITSLLLFFRRIVFLALLLAKDFYDQRGQPAG